MNPSQEASQEGLRVHFAMIPNFVDDLDLSQKAYRLYGHLKRVAGENGKCEEGVDAMSKKCRMNKDTLIAAKRELVTKKLVKIKPASSRTKPDELVILDVWKRNSKAFQSEERVPNGGTHASQSEERVASEIRERKKREEQKSIKEPSKEGKKKTPRYKPSQEEYRQKCEAFLSSDPLATELKSIIDRAAAQNRDGKMSWGRMWNGFISVVVEARKKHSEPVIRYALQETNQRDIDDMRYPRAIMRNTPNKPTPVPKDEPLDPGANSEEAAARRTEGYEFFFA